MTAQADIESQNFSPADNNPADNDPLGWKKEWCDLLSAVAGGSIVGLPLLFTMEMWWHGASLSEWHLLVILACILALNFGFDLLSGFRERYSIGSAISESITSVGIGILFSVVVLSLIGELHRDLAPSEWAGKILAEALVVSVGVSFANSQIRKKSRTGDETTGDEKNEDKSESGAADQEPDDSGTNDSGTDDSGIDAEKRQLTEDLRDMGATLAGATVFALNIAPTEEILLIASRISLWHQLAMLSFSVVLCHIILFASGLDEAPVHVDTLFQKPWAETIVACALSLLVAFVLLLLLGQGTVTSNPSMLLAATITLGLPAVVGGAAGRIIA